MTNNLPVGHSLAEKIPPNATMNAWEVLIWIAFREIRPRSDIDETIDFTLRWGHSDGSSILEALEARSAAAPHYLVSPVIIDWLPWDGRSYTNPAMS